MWWENFREWVLFWVEYTLFRKMMMKSNTSFSVKILSKLKTLWNKSEYLKFFSKELLRIFRAYLRRIGFQKRFVYIFRTAKNGYFNRPPPPLPPFLCDKIFSEALKILNPSSHSLRVKNFKSSSPLFAFRNMWAIPNVNVRNQNISILSIDDERFLNEKYF